MSHISLLRHEAKADTSIQFTIFPAQRAGCSFLACIPAGKDGLLSACRILQRDLQHAYASLSAEDAQLLAMLVLTAKNEAAEEGLSRLVQALGLTGIPYPYPLFVNSLGWLYTVLEETVPTDMAQRIIAQHPRFWDRFTQFKGETATIYAGFCLRPGTDDWMHIHSTRWTKSIKEACCDLRQFAKEQHYRAITKR